MTGPAKAFQRELVGGGDGAGKIGVNHDAVQVAGDQQVRVFQAVAVAQELVVSGGKVLVSALVIHAEEAAVLQLAATGRATAARKRVLTLCTCRKR